MHVPTGNPHSASLLAEPRARSHSTAFSPPPSQASGSGPTPWKVEEVGEKRDFGSKQTPEFFNKKAPN